MFADEKVVHTVASLAPPLHLVGPLLLMPLSIFVAFIQTFVFILLSQLYLSEVSHAPHEEHARRMATMLKHPITAMQLRACGSGDFLIG